MCTIAAALGAASSVASYAGQAQQAAAANTAALANAQSASISAGYKYADLGQKYIYDSKGLQREANKAVMQGRAAIASGVSSAGDAGVSGLSLNSLIADTRREAAENAWAAKEKRDDMRTALILNDKSVEAEAQGRINSMPMQSGPSPLGLAIGIGSSIAQGGQKSGWWDAGFPKILPG